MQPNSFTIFSVRRVVAPVLLLLSYLAFFPNANAATGVSDERVVLPDGPGSIGGIGENAEVDPNMGQMSYTVTIELPPGHEGMTPSLSLGYSSGSGSSEVGIGWRLTIPHIERMSLWGLPEYNVSDDFAVNESDELIRVDADGASHVYRARFEKGFVRYAWHEPGNGDGGYWTAEYPDGSIGYFGANKSGEAVDSARVTDEAGRVFRYHLVASVDPFGHRIEYGYTKYGDYALIDSIGYVYNGGDTPRFSVRFIYEERQDIISDCVPGFELQLDQRLTDIQIYSGAEQIRRYQLTYEGYAFSGGFSRLSSVTQFGRNDVRHPIRFSFGYSQALGGTCEGACETPYMVDMGSLPNGVDISTGLATLIDINGDALPDVLSTSLEGEHLFYMSSFDVGTNPSFSDRIVESSATMGGSPFILNAPGVQVLDVNGDGFTDIISSRTGTVLCNDGSGDWSGTDCLADSTLPVLDEDEDDEGEGDPLHVRFMDYDNDKRIDMMRTQQGLTEVYANTGSAFEQTNVQDIGAVFDDTSLQLADMNGDNLQDPVQVLTELVRYRLNFGFGNWSEWIEVPLEGINETAALSAQLEDLNGDGLADLVMVMANEVLYALNRNGSRFDAVTTITSADVTGDLPERTSETTVLFADMNGNGSDDILWMTNNGKVDFLELFPVKPNLLSRIENGIGYVQTVSYGTSVAEQARDKVANPWRYKLPHAMNVVTGTDTWVTLTGDETGQGLHEQVTYQYHHGFYDGAEKSFRGYAEVEVIEHADLHLDSQESGVTAYLYDVGATDPYYNGMLLKMNLFGGEESDLYPIHEERHIYGECPLEDVPKQGLTRQVRFICEQETIRVIQEGAPASEWATIRTLQAYDGYGNVAETANLGVVHYGPPESPSACEACESPSNRFGAPCGADCLGDEQYSETTYITPGTNTAGLWLIGKPSRTIGYGTIDGPMTETLIYYDGEPFIGMPLGQLTQGKVSRITQKLDQATDEVVNTQRNSFDAHGNVIETIDPNGDVAIPTTHRRKYTYDTLGLKVVKAEILLEDKEQNPYALVREIAHEASFLKPSEATAWMADGKAGVTSARNSTRYRYDEHGRIIRLIKPGDSDAAPTAEYAYELGDPASRIVVRARSVSGASADLEEVRCIDGQGREFQRRTRIAEGTYQVTGFTEFNRRGAEVRVYQPYSETTGTCETAPPEGVLFAGLSYDAANRAISTTAPDAAIYGTASVVRTEFLPLSVYNYDQEDTDAESPFFDTPNVEHLDGLGRLVSIERHLLTDDPAPAVLSVFYDSLGRLSGYEDAAGNVKTQSYDLFGRVVRVDDPNSGTTTFDYDDASNLIGKQDARGESLSMFYDGANRQAALWNPNDPDASRVIWTYDGTTECADCINASGRLARVTYPLGDFGQGVDEYAYDARGQPFFTARTIEGYRYKTDFVYDNTGRLVTTTHPDGTVVSSTYDDASRIIGIDGVLDSVSYNAKGLMTSVAYANGLTQIRSYDDLNRVQRISAIDVASTVLQGWDYTRSRSGNILKTVDLSETGEGSPSFQANYSYDSWYRLLEVIIDPAVTEAETVTYAYDEIDNINSITSSRGAASRAHVGPYTYNTQKPNAVSQAGSIAVTYDAAGAVKSRQGKSFVWDYLGRMVEARGADGMIGRFLFGANERRIAKLENGGAVFYINPDFEVRDGIGTAYPRLGRTRIARIESDALADDTLSDLAPIGAPDNTITAADAWLAHASSKGIIKLTTVPSDTDRLLNSAARRNLLSNREQIVFLHHDHLGSATLATTESGAVDGERAHYPSGTTRFESGYVDEYGFTGQMRDQSTGYLHFSHRLLDPITGRWNSPDPAFNRVTDDALKKKGESTTAYAYVANNFDNAVDPTGLTRDGSTSGQPPRKDTLARKKQTHTNKKIGSSVEKKKEGSFSSAEKGSSKSSNSTTGTAEWPPNNGFREGTQERVILGVGLRINRYGSEGGSFTSPEGTTFEERSLPESHRSKPFTTYEVTKPTEVLSGDAAEAFNQTGGGIQYQHFHSIAQEIQLGNLRRVDNETR